jgi:hypothetical protein
LARRLPGSLRTSTRPRSRGISAIRETHPVLGVTSLIAAEQISDRGGTNAAVKRDASFADVNRCSIYERILGSFLLCALSFELPLTIESGVDRFGLFRVHVRAPCHPLLVVPIQVRYGWRAPFFVFGLLGVGWSLAWYVWFRDSPHEKDGVSAAELRGIGSTPGLQRHGMPGATALRIPALWRIAAIGVCYVYALGFFQSWLQTYLVRGRGFTEAALVLSSLTYAVGATANGLGGLAGDWMVKRHGLRNGRRWLGVAGLSAAALLLTAAILAPSGNLALVFLSCAYGGILFQQPSLCALCLDVGRRNAGAVFGFMNTAANAASALSAVVFGYLVVYSGNYHAPFLPMVALLAFGALLWLQVDPTRELLPEELPDESVSAGPLRSSAVLQTTSGHMRSE